MHPAVRTRTAAPRPAATAAPQPRTRRVRSLIDAEAIRVLHRAARVLMDDLADLTDRLMAVVQDQEPAYRAAVESDPAGVWQEMHRSLRHSVASLLDPRGARDGARRCSWRIGATRAEQGLPLDAVLHAFRLGGSLVWQGLVEETSRRAPEDVRLLVHVATDVWNFVDEHCTIVTDAYRQVERQLTWRRENQVRLLAAALLDGTSRIADLPETARALEMPEHGRYVVVAVADGGLGGARGAAVVRGGARVHWHAGVDVDYGIVLLGDGDGDGEGEGHGDGRGDGDGHGGANGRGDGRTHARVNTHAAGTRTGTGTSGVGPRDPRAARNLPEPTGDPGTRIGVSGPVDGLAAVGEARRLADTALRMCPADGGTIRLAEHLPAALVVSSPELGATLADRVLGPLERVDPADREILLATLATWLSCDGSAQRAGERLYCHRNTVLNRLRRFEQLTGRSLARPSDLVEISLALTARRLLHD
ncbi:helix-turn-helix domain-containing protein [Streptomyces sp. NPDC052687]|uniref:PucR family transcriptional regulator n=1 Tax=Streptomyces sp. NPDC052687 TaxID=3154759 RepID=UPI00344A5FF4